MNERVRKTISLNESLIFEKKFAGACDFDLPPLDVDECANNIPCDLLRNEVTGFPELSEIEIVRHFTRLSTWNYHVDAGFYPLGSCTMKYNPKINEKLARTQNFLDAHPLQLHENAQGSLILMKELEDLLVKITGMDGVTLQPAAGAHGELTGIMLIRSALAKRGNPRKKILIPDSAHGTNPASAVLCGYATETLKSDENGCINVEELKKALNKDVACLMLTNPNTLGVFEENILQIAEAVHENGSFLYMDGANFNAFIGVATPGDMGVDVMHLNLHKTFATPHGGGGPGSGPVVVKSEFIPLLPVPIISGHENGTLFLDYDRPETIGKVSTFYGNFGILVRALAYIMRQGSDGLRSVAQNAVLNANYIRAKLINYLHLQYDRPSLHEVVFDDSLQMAKNISTMDMAKRLLDAGFHPPTVYFPLIVHGAIMIEPTETEPKEEIDAFIDSFIKILKEADENPEILKSAPNDIRFSRFDETGAARKPVIVYKPEGR